MRTPEPHFWGDAEIGVLEPIGFVHWRATSRVDCERQFFLNRYEAAHWLTRLWVTYAAGVHNRT